uniref:CN hydrolase domain-containing protein n=1 Tax=Macrostomum lignano TaxID=282301 RepID=A0A1I8FCF7_9PLAT
YFTCVTCQDFETTLGTPIGLIGTDFICATRLPQDRALATPAAVASLPMPLTRQFAYQQITNYDDILSILLPNQSESVANSANLSQFEIIIIKKMSDREEIFKLEGDANFDEQEDDEEEEEDDDSSMPELGCEVSIEDLCCDADDECGNSNAAAAARPEPRRLTCSSSAKVEFVQPARWTADWGLLPHLLAILALILAAMPLALLWTPPGRCTIRRLFTRRIPGVGSVTSPEVQPERAPSSHACARQRGGPASAPCLSRRPPADEDEAAEQSRCS